MTDAPRYVTVADLAECGLSPQDVRQRCPLAVEYTALGGSSCWLREELAGLLNGKEGSRGDDREP